jgi:hypothetical protein
MNEKNQDKTEELLKEFYVHRDAVKCMIADLEKLKERIDKLFPETLDARYIRFFEEKIKTITSLFTSLLEMRKEIAKNVKEEIEIRSRMSDDTPEEEIEKYLDVRKMADRVEEFRRSAECTAQKLRDTPEEIPENVKIPGVNVGIIS